MSKKAKVWTLVGALTTAIVATLVALFLIGRIDYSLKTNPEFEINDERNARDLFEAISFGEVENSIIDTSELGEHEVSIIIKNGFGNQETITTSYKVVDTISPTIEGDETITVLKNDVSGILKNYDIKDNSGTELKTSLSSECDTTIIQSCNTTITVTDEAGNQSTKDITVSIVADPAIASLGKNEYYIKVNRSQNVVMVYALGKDGQYNNLVKTFVSSTGKVGSETPLGVFTISSKYEALYLVGNVWGHYAVRIIGPYYFHSVPYFTKGNPHWDNLEYLEYNKLGGGASAGCVRLATKDVKWIYDNVPAGTKVEIYDSDTLPEGVVKPEAIKIDVESPNRGWDPTDIDSANPWGV